MRSKCFSTFAVFSWRGLYPGRSCTCPLFFHASLTPLHINAFRIKGVGERYRLSQLTVDETYCRETIRSQTSERALNEYDISASIDYLEKCVSAQRQGAVRRCDLKRAEAEWLPQMSDRAVHRLVMSCCSTGRWDLALRIMQALEGLGNFADIALYGRVLVVLSKAGRIVEAYSWSPGPPPTLPAASR